MTPNAPACPYLSPAARQLLRVVLAAATVALVGTMAWAAVPSSPVRSAAILGTGRAAPHGASVQPSAGR